MASESFRSVLNSLWGQAAAAPAGGPMDGPLLEAFLLRQDEATFATLLRRFGPMVLGVCRRVLRDPHDSEDAFQATFLVLLRKAPSLAHRELLGNWLYGVALRTALKARANRGRRRALEQQVLAQDVPAAAEVLPAEKTELRAQLDAEVGRLPGKYRQPVVLCCLQGLTLAEAARQLGWPVGTVSGRLARARALLRRRLVRRGVPVSAAAAFASEAPAAVPAPLASLTARAALALLGNRGMTSASISPVTLALTKGVLRTMFLTKLMTAASLVITATLVAACAAAVAYVHGQAEPPRQSPEGVVQPPRAAGVPAAPQGQPSPAADPTVDDKVVLGWLDKLKETDRMKALLKERYEAARTACRTRYEQYQAGRGTLETLLAASAALLAAEREMTDRKADLVVAREQHVRRLKDIELTVRSQYEAGKASLADFAQVTFFRADAEIELERARGK